MKPYYIRRSGKSRLPQQQRDPGNRVFESTSARGKIRGTARQLIERYLQFAEEARLANDRVASEAFLQSAEHYIRISNPVPVTTDEPVTATRPARAPVAAVKRFPATGTPEEISVPPAFTDPAPEPESIILKEASRRQEVESPEDAGIASKRALAAAALERVALQHGYTLAQLGLTLRLE